MEDCVTVETVAKIRSPHLRYKALIAVGVGCDRHNTVSDGSTLRAMAELRGAGGFAGSIALEGDSDAVRFYEACLGYLHTHGRFRSVISNSIL